MLCRGFWAITTIPRDVSALLRFLWAQHRVHHAKNTNSTVSALFQDVARQNSNKTAFLEDGRHWSFHQVEELSNQIGHCFSADGFRPGNVICVFMGNSVEYVCSWLGLSKIGVIPALVNSQVRDLSLLHCIRVASCKAILCGPDQHKVLNSLTERTFIAHLPVYVWDTHRRHMEVKGAIDLQKRLTAAPSHAPPKPDNVGYRSDLLYIYTSGTTGMPKAAPVTNSRAIFMITGTHYMTGMSKKDVLYIPLPLSHTTGGLLGVGQTLLFGCTSVIRNKFSAQNYWSDVCQYNATVGMYIGELCSYLLAAKERPEERKHKIHMMTGNGMRQDIWREFEKRFRVGAIREFYGSTEGNASLVNTTGKRGSLGFVSLILPNFYSVALLSCDLTTGKLTRSENGLCIQCKPGETGQLVGLIAKDDPAREFRGYVSQGATRETLVRDVLRKGDSAFLTGDLLMMDRQGYLYFRDRLGDTFRWKGENVSTMEVEAAIKMALGNTVDVVVYGVEVKGHDGKAGMATLLAQNNTLDLDALTQHLVAALPPYAVPRFIRITTELELTDTLKLKKYQLQQEGFNPKSIDDDMYFLNQADGQYVPLTKFLYQRILAGEEKL